MKLDSKEKIILFLNNQNKSSNNTVSIYRSDVKNIGLSEKEVVQTLSLMENKYFTTKTKSPNNDLSMPWIVTLKDDYTDYFKKKKKERRKYIINEVRAWITLAIAVSSLVLSICNTV